MVMRSFQNRCQNAQDVEGNLESEIEWEAEFTLDGFEHTAVCESEGIRLEKERQIAYNEVTPTENKLIMR
jgi:hypothetical protein